MNLRNLVTSVVCGSLIFLAQAEAGKHKAPTTGEVVVNTEPTGATISVDGKAMGNSPVTAKELAPGSHAVEAAWADGGHVTQSVEVQAGGSVTVALTAPPKPVPVVAAAPVEPAPVANTSNFQLRTTGRQEFPGKIQFGFNPIGFQTGMGGSGYGGYKVSLDASKNMYTLAPDLDLWIGGGLNYAIGSQWLVTSHDVQFWAFGMLTINKIFGLPIVPFARVGIPFDLLSGWGTGGALGLRFGGGAYYWLFKQLGFGVDTNFMMGAAFGNGYSGYYGTYDFGIGARYIM